MAGNDMKCDALGSIEDFIEEKIRGILEYPMNEYQDPNWAQAAEIFSDIIIPCGSVYFTHDRFLELGKNIVKKAKENNCQVIYYYGCGYNAVVNNPHIKGFTREQKVDYTYIIQNIERWVEDCHEFWTRIRHQS